MGTKYSSNAASGYNSTPPSDDGAATEANKVKWSTIKNKLSDPIKTLADNINTDINTALDYGPVSLTSAALTLAAQHNAQYIDMTGASTPSLTSANGLGAGWWVDIVNNGASTVTVARLDSGDTIDSVTADVTMSPLDYIRFVVNAAATGFVTIKSKDQSSYVATAAQVSAGTASTVFLTPENYRGARATQAEVNSHSDGYKYVTPGTLGGFIGRGAFVYNSGNTSVSSGTYTSISWDTEEFDTDTIHSIVSVTSRLTVPAGVHKIRLYFQISWASNATGYRSIQIRKNGSATFNGFTSSIVNAVNGAGTNQNVSSPVISSNSGDYYEVFCIQNSGSNLQLNGLTGSWFCMEIIK